MIVQGRVGRIDRYGAVIEDSTQTVVLAVVQSPDPTPKPGDNARQYLLAVMGAEALALELAALRKLIWLGRRARAPGAVLAVDGAVLQVVDGLLLDIDLVGTDDAAARGMLRIRGSRCELELGLSSVIEALAEACVSPRFREMEQTVH